MEKYYKLGDFKEFLISLMKNEIVEAIMVPMKSLTEETYSPFLIKDVELLNNCEPISPVMSINAGRAISTLTSRGPLEYKTAVVLKPCELRAYRELIKFRQINPGKIITISFDCDGINSLNNDGEKREICNMCKNFTPDFADIEIFSFGLETPIIKTSLDISSINLEEVSVDIEKRNKEVENKLKENLANREKNSNYISENLESLLKECVVCHNCMRVCPICYCPECFFDSPQLKGDSESYLLRVNRLNSLKFPENKILFHLGRMNHMSISCVSCGMCEDACPASVPVAQIFAASGDKLRKLFNYEPGRELSEPVPFMKCQANEFVEYAK
jgi:formate dehydrogenase subunit beta